MTTPTPPAVSEAMREAVARAIRQFVTGKTGSDYELIQALTRSPEAIAEAILSGPIASEIARLTGERDVAEMLLERRKADLRAAEAETARLRAALEALRPLSETAAPGDWSVSGVRSRVDEPSCVIVNAPSCPGLLALPTSHGDKALEALRDAKFAVAAVNFVRAALTSQEKTDV